MRWLRVNWPAVNVHTNGRGRGDIKTISVDQLERLQAGAAAHPGWSATGRPAWVREHRDRIRQVLLTVLGVELPSVYRCIVTVILDDGTGGFFSLEVAFRDFDGFTEISAKSLVTFAHRYLSNFPHVNLDPEQRAAWEQLKGKSRGI